LFSNRSGLKNQGLPALQKALIQYVYLKFISESTLSFLCICPVHFFHLSPMNEKIIKLADKYGMIKARKKGLMHII
jgi:hypothetical protein